MRCIKWISKHLLSANNGYSGVYLSGICSLLEGDNMLVVLFISGDYFWLFIHCQEHVYIETVSNYNVAN